MSWNQIHAILADPAAQTIASLIPLAWAVIAFCTKFVWKKKGWLGAFLNKHDSIPVFLIGEGTSFAYSLWAALSAPATRVHSRLIEPDRLAIFTQSFVNLTIESIICVVIYVLIVACIKAYIRHRKTTKSKALEETRQYQIIDPPRSSRSATKSRALEDAWQYHVYQIIDPPRSSRSAVRLPPSRPIRRQTSSYPEENDPPTETYRFSRPPRRVNRDDDTEERGRGGN